MIVIFIDEIENFLAFLGKRIMNEIFYEFKEIKGSSDLSSDIIVEIILHYLAKVETYVVLYETKLNISKANPADVNKEVITELKKIFSSVDSNLTLVKGKIREIFISHSS